jgi:hypothetical protein
MGHVMTSGYGFARARLGRFDADLALGVDHALGQHGAHHHHMSVPLIEPMNETQLGSSGHVGAALGAGLRAALTCAFAQPIGDGERLAGAAGSLAFERAGYRASAEVGRGFLGNPVGWYAGLGIAASLW